MIPGTAGSKRCTQRQYEPAAVVPPTPLQLAELNCSHATFMFRVMHVTHVPLQ